MAKTILIKETNIIKKSNALARAKRSSSSDSIWIGRMIAIVASQVHKKDADFKEYNIPVTVILDTTNKSRSGQFYDDLIKSIKKAMGMIVEIENEREWRAYHMFDTCRYVKGSGIVNVKIHPDLKPHYLNLQSNFTQYRLIEYLSLPSIYSQMLYEYLRSWDDQFERTESIQKLHEIFATPPSLRRNFYDFNRRALKKAYRDIHKYTKLKFEYEAIKRGRKVVKIKFLIGKKTMQKAKIKQMQNENKKQQKKDNKLFLEAIECAKKHKNKDNFCAFRGTKKCCSACF